MRTISVVIPTYKRPEMLAEALQSVMGQTLKPSEVLVGDDSPDACGKAVVERLQTQTQIPLRYFHNSPSLKQAGNVGMLIQKAQGELVSLLHDDDWMLPNALEDLYGCFEKHPSIIAAYGKQQIASHDGVVDPKGSEELNRTFERTPDKEGAQENALTAAITQQFPNNAWLVRADLAKAVDYASHEAQFGNTTDFAFGVKLAQLGKGIFYFINRTTAVYRLSNTSILRNNPLDDCAYHSFRYVNSLDDSTRKTPAVCRWLKENCKGAIAQATTLGKTSEAWEWFFGPYHRGALLTPGGIRRFLKLLTARKKSTENA